MFHTSIKVSMNIKTIGDRVMDELTQVALNTGVAIAIAVYLLKFVTDRVFKFLTDTIIEQLNEITITQKEITNSQELIVSELKQITNTQKEIIEKLIRVERCTHS